MIENLNERLKAKREEVDNALAAKLEKEHNEYVAVQEKALALMPEVREVLETCKAIYKNGFTIPYRGDHSTRNPERFFSDGWHHNFGFVAAGARFNIKVPIYVGWYNGGACGSWDIVCNGYDIFSIHEKTLWHDHKEFGKVEKNQYEKFINRWPQFKEDFYKWLEEELL